MSWMLCACDMMAAMLPDLESSALALRCNTLLLGHVSSGSVQQPCAACTHEVQRLKHCLCSTGCLASGSATAAHAEPGHSSRHTGALHLHCTYGAFGPRPTATAPVQSAAAALLHPQSSGDDP